MPTLAPLLKGLTTANPMESRNLRLTPLMRATDADPGPDYALAAEAFQARTLRVAEVDESGVVGELIAENTAELPILLIDGEELIGAKQNRILNTDVLLSAGSKKRLPVSCVEEGRWHHVSPDFQAGGHSPSSMRARKSRSVGMHLRAEGKARSDQGEVWEDVDRVLCEMSASSGTAAMSDAFAQRENDLTSIVNSLPCPADAAGVIVEINGCFVGLDMFDCSETLARLWSRLVTGYAADALARSDAESTETMGKASADRCVAALSDLEATACPAVDLGEDWRFDTLQFVGSALIVKGVALHLSAFPAQPVRDREGGLPGMIAGPGRRGRRVY